MSNKSLTHVVGTFLIQAEGAFLNGAGGRGGGGDQNEVMPKTFWTLGENNRPVEIPYVSSQSWKRWLRETFQDENSDELAAEFKAEDFNVEGNTSKAGTVRDPVVFAEDDIFGYMRATKGQGRTAASGDEDEEETEKPKEGIQPSKTKGERVASVMRTSPFHASLLVSLRKTGWRGEDEGYVYPTAVAETYYQSVLEELVQKKDSKLSKKQKEGVRQIAEEISTQAIRTQVSVTLLVEGLRQLSDDKTKTEFDQAIDKIQRANPTPLPYKTQFYNTQLQGVFGLNYERLGMFRNEGDRIELDRPLVNKYLKEGKIQKTDASRDIYEMVTNPRKDRATKILKSLAVLRGGAKQAAFATDVAPKVVILAGLSCGNLIFNDLFEDTKDGPKLKLDTLKEVITDYAERIITSVFIGVRTGYLHPDSEKELREWTAHQSEKVVLTTPIQAVAQMTEALL
jgi:CRISPR-associated protein Cst2